MRVAASSLSLSLLLFAGAALAQGADSPAGSDARQNRPGINTDRYELTGPSPGQTQSGQMPQGMMQRHHQMMMQSGQMPQGMTQRHRQMMQQDDTAQQQPGRMGQAGPGIVTFTTRAQIKQSLEQSGFKNVRIVPQAYLIRAQAPDGSRVVVQVSPEGLYGVVFDRIRDEEAGSGGSLPQGGGAQDNR